MSEVLGMVLQNTMRTAAHFGLDLDRLCEGLPFRRPEDLGARERVPWPKVCTFFSRLPGDDVTCELFAAHYNTGLPALRALGGLISSLRPFLEIYNRTSAIASPFIHVRWRFEQNLMAVEARMPEVFAPCETFFRLSAYAYVHCVEAIGHPPLGINRMAVDGRGFSLLLELRAPAASSDETAFLSVQLLLNAFIDQDGNGPLDLRQKRKADEIVRLQREFGLTRAEARVSLEIADGLNPREASTNLGISYETARTHLRRVYAKLELASQRELSDRIAQWRVAPGSVLTRQ